MDKENKKSAEQVEDNLPDINCLFCQTQDENGVVHILDEDEHTVAYLHDKPVAKGHTVVVTKKHTGNLVENDDEEVMKHTLSAIKRISKKLKEVFKTDKVNVVYQDTDNEHLEFHIVPVFNTGAAGSGPSVQFVSVDNHFDVNDVYDEFKDFYE